MLKDALRKIAGILDKNEVPYALIGALAVAVHGAVRATKDVDLIIDWPLAKGKDLADRLKREGLQAEFRRGDLDDPVAGVIRATFTDLQGSITIDLLFPSRAWQRSIVSRAESVDQEGSSVRVAQAQDVFHLKLYAGGPQDLLDAANLLRQQETETRAAWRTTAEKLHMVEGYQRCLRFMK